MSTLRPAPSKVRPRRTETPGESGARHRTQSDAEETIHAAIDCLGRLSAVFSLRREQLAARVGLTEHQWSVLEEISTEHFMPSLFAKQRDSSAAAVSKTLRQLLDRGVVAASISKEDARQRRYVLTPKGKRTMVALRALREEAIQSVWRDLEVEQMKEFTRFGSLLTSKLEKYAGTGERPGAERRSSEGHSSEKRSSEGKE